jgi:cytidylate kinase
MTVILLTQEPNSPGDQIAAGLAASLRFELVRKEQIEQHVAEQMQVSQRTVRRLLEGNASLVERCMILPNRLVPCMAEEVVKLAARGNIVVESCGMTNRLRHIRHVVCVRVCAARSRLPKTAVNCSRIVRHPQSHRGHTKLRRWWSAHNREDFDHYDLVLNTERIPVDECVEQVLRLARSPQFQPTAASHALLARLEQDMCKDFPVHDLDTERAAQVLQVDVAGDTIILPTTISSEEAIARVERHLRGRNNRGAVASSLVTRQGIF